MNDSTKISYKDIQGWFDYQDLYTQMVEKLQPNDIAVEVGTWMGKSAAFFVSELIRQEKNVRFYCVDLWCGKQDDAHMESIIEQNGGSILQVFEDNMEKCGYQGKYNKIVGDSALSARKFADKSISFCFIDANHNYESVKRDIQAWLPKLKPNSYIGGHDADRPSVTKAVQECLGSKWEKTSERCWICKIT